MSGELTAGKLLIAVRYVGTNYCGYQVQPNGPTVQAALNAAAEALFGYPCDIVGCSRTDSGVHAECFCATLARRECETLETRIPVGRIPRALCQHLPPDIAVWGAKWVPVTFHARYDVIEKAYTYRIHNAPHASALYRNITAHVPYKLDYPLMQNALNDLLGTHDFAAFQAAGGTAKTTVRTLTDIQLMKDGDLLTLTVCGNAFLYNMVRIITGTMLDIGMGRKPADAFRTALETGDRLALGITAPASGLELTHVYYADEEI